MTIKTRMCSAVAQIERERERTRKREGEGTREGGRETVLLECKLQKLHHIYESSVPYKYGTDDS
jgi:hypothetical protein